MHTIPASLKENAAANIKAFVGISPKANGK
jgi:hypothetical protein